MDVFRPSEMLIRQILKSKMSKQSVVLNFHETLLHKSDVDLLSGPHWLNDTVISFYFEYLEKVAYRDENDMLFVSPEVTQCVKMIAREEIGVFLDPLKVRKRNFIFFALNDNDRPDSAGGTHWSLLVYSKPEQQIFHFDSSEGSNHDHAWDLAMHLVSYLSGKINGHIDFIIKDTLQQTNGYDCGIHLLCNVDMLAEHILLNRRVENCGIVNHSVVKQKRSELLQIIEQLTKD